MRWYRRQKEPRHIRLGRWHHHFAWLPCRSRDGTVLIWLETCWRKMLPGGSFVYMAADGDDPDFLEIECAHTFHANREPEAGGRWRSRPPAVPLEPIRKP